MNLPTEFPYVIETKAQAVAIGHALHEVLHFDADWSVRVFNGDAKFEGQTRDGPGALTAELRSMWRDYWSEDERRRVMAAYIAARIER